MDRGRRCLRALLFSVWISQWLAGADARRCGDGNPGAANTWRAGGWPLGLAVLLSLVGLLGYRWLRRAETKLLVIGLGSAAILKWTHRQELRLWPRMP